MVGYRRLASLLILAAGWVMLGVLGRRPDLRDFALIVALFALLPLQVVWRATWGRWPARLAASLGCWCLLWALPLGTRVPWYRAWATGVEWLKPVADLVPFFCVPAAVFAVIALLRREPRAAAE